MIVETLFCVGNRVVKAFATPQGGPPLRSASARGGQQGAGASRAPAKPRGPAAGRAPAAVPSAVPRPAPCPRAPAMPTVGGGRCRASRPVRARVRRGRLRRLVRRCSRTSRRSWCASDFSLPHARFRCRSAWRAYAPYVRARCGARATPRRITTTRARPAHPWCAAQLARARMRCRRRQLPPELSRSSCRVRAPLRLARTHACVLRTRTRATRCAPRRDRARHARAARRQGARGHANRGRDQGGRRASQAEGFARQVVAHL